MKRHPTRRQVLHGLGGFTLALPFLPSLLKPGEARAAAPAAPKRFVAFATQHGGIWGANMYPAASTLTDSLSYAGRTVRRGALALSAGPNGTSQLSPVLAGPSTLLTAKLAAKLNVLRGLDTAFYIGHHTGGHLGNYARNDGNGSDGVAMQAYATPTIDQLMAWSPSFYGSLAGNLVRQMIVGSRISYNWANPQTRSGAIQELAGTNDALGLFNKIFVAPTGPAAPDPNAPLRPVADRVLADYNRLRNSNTRLSANDRARLDDHMQRISELQRRLQTLPAGAQCGNVKKLTTDTTKLINQSSYQITPSLMTQVYQAFNDVIVAAFMCDTSRIAVVNIDEDFSSYVGDWHQDVAHHAVDPDGAKQAIISAAHQATFAGVFLDLCAKLDVDDGSGATYLDSSLVVWSHESGEQTHAGQGMPVITAGSAGGFLKTGNYCDYRNPSLVVSDDSGGHAVITAGLLRQQFFGTVLQSMGLGKSEYEQNGLGGYPGAIKFIGSNFYSGTSGATLYPDVVWNAAGDLLPFLKA